MSNETHGEPADSSELLPKKKRQVSRGLPTFLQGGKFVMIFGAQRPPNAVGSSEEAKTEINTDSISHVDSADEATDNTVSGSSA
jgi:hypothetical protein